SRPSSWRRTFVPAHAGSPVTSPTLRHGRSSGHFSWPAPSLLDSDQNRDEPSASGRSALPMRSRQKVKETGSLHRGSPLGSLRLSVAEKLTFAWPTLLRGRRLVSKGFVSR